LKFFFAKRPKVCQHCKGKIKRGELFVQTNNRNRETGRFYCFSYHYDCYPEYFMERYRKDALHYKEQMGNPQKAGRKRIYSDPVKAYRLLSLIAYHEKAGHLDRAQEVKEDLKKLLLTKDTE
jgi:hypothetical protein